MSDHPDVHRAVSVRRTTVEIDTEALRTAAIVLGTTSIEDTVDEALREVARRGALARAAQYVLDGRIHLPDEGTFAACRAPPG
jgi:Arc/MetJ family transcription regulator